MAGHLISFEGLDGVGKTTQVQLLYERLAREGHPVTVYREPGGTALGEQLREMLKAGLAQGQSSELLLFITARAELIELRVRPDLAAGKIVILDRYVDSTWAYQGARGIGDEILHAANQLGTGGLLPHVTFWLDLPPQQAWTRTIGDPQRSVARLSDIFEQRTADYFAEVQRRYAQIAVREAQRIVRVDATRPPADIAEEIYAESARRLGLRSTPIPQDVAA